MDREQPSLCFNATMPCRRLNLADPIPLYLPGNKAVEGAFLYHRPDCSIAWSADPRLLLVYLPILYSRMVLRYVPALCALSISLLLASCSDGVNNVTVVDDTYCEVDRAIPAAAIPGQLVEIKGHGFGTDTGRIHVEVGDIPVEIISLHPQFIRIRVPQGARARSITIRKGGGNSTMVGYTIPFQVIESPYPFTAYEVKIDGLIGVTARSISSSDGEMIAWNDTSEVAIHNRRADLTGPTGEFCSEYTNGDTVRICNARNATSERGGSYDRFTCTAIVDSAQGIIVGITMESVWGAEENVSAVDGTLEQGWSRLVLWNLPYMRQEDGSLQVDIRGADISRYIAVYEDSRSASRRDEKGWRHTTQVFQQRFSYGDASRLQLRLYRWQ